MDEMLKELLESLARIGQSHEEIYDSDCRDAMREAVHDGFLEPVSGYCLPLEYGLSSEEGNQEVRDALAGYIELARATSRELGLNFRGRLMAFQNHKVFTARGTTSDEFFGYTAAELFTESGEWLGPS